MILTTKGECLQNMSTRGWKLFCEHSIENKNGDPATWSDEEEITLNRVEVCQYEYSSMSNSNIGGFWHEGKSIEDIEQAALNDSGSVTFNLMEDIFILKEMLSHSQSQSALASILPLSGSNNQYENTVDWDAAKSKTLSLSEDFSVDVEYHPESDGGKEQGGTNAMLAWHYKLPSGNAVKIYLEEAGSFEIEHLLDSNERYGGNTIAHEKTLTSAIESSLASQNEYNMAIIHFYQSHCPVSLKDDLVDAWWIDNEKEESNALFIPWEVRTLGSKYVENYIDDLLACHDDYGYTKTWQIDF